MKQLIHFRFKKIAVFNLMLINKSDVKLGTTSLYNKCSEAIFKTFEKDII
jgi:hypothetical protein